MSSTAPLRFRQIHLDFHTGPAIPDVGSEFNPETFARAMKEAHVNSVTVFAKCHHGHLYYNTSRPERHPGLRRDLDLLKEQVDALHRAGIRAPIYISVQCDEYAANTHPEWVARKTDSSMVMWRGQNTWFAPGWQIMDMSTPYQQFLADQTEEILRLFHPVDGIFFDMCWDQPSSTREAIDAMLHVGLNPENEDDRAQYAHHIALKYMDRFHRMVKASSPEASVYFNGRQASNLAEEARFQEQVEIEALPTGGWGYTFFPKTVRFARNFGKQYMGMTARFHKSWADFGGIKPYAALEYETSQMMAHGARCSIGDQLHPRGTLDPAAYDLIGRIYQRVEAREQWLEGATSVTQIGVFQAPLATSGSNIRISGIDEGVTRLLSQLKHQFDLVDPGSDWEKYELVILPDVVTADDTLSQRLRSYLQKGGRVLATGTSLLSADAANVALSELGVRAHGESPFTTTYIRLEDEIAPAGPHTDHVMYERGARVVASGHTKTLARVVEPYFERTWQHFSSHSQTPGDRVSAYAAATENPVGNGGLLSYIAYPIFRAYATHGNLSYRLLVGKLIERLLPDPLVRVQAPASAEVTLTAQNGRHVAHLLYYAPERRTSNLDIVEDVVPLHDVPLSVRLEKPPTGVYLAPTGETLPFTWSDGRANLTVPEIRGHAMVVFE